MTVRWRTVLLLGFIVGMSRASAYAGQVTTPSADARPESAAPPIQSPPAQAGQPPSDDQAARKEKEREQAGTRMFGVLPNYSTVEPDAPIEPVSAAGKFQLATLNTFDPYVYPFVGIVAAADIRYGSGASAYARQYLASFSDNAVGNFMTSAVMPSLLHQDPRYYQRGSGTAPGRIAYAASRILVTRGDSGHRQFNLSEVSGNAVVTAFSNVYYPAAEKTVSATLSRWGLQLMWDALSNELKEFWPDVRRKLHDK